MNPDMRGIRADKFLETLKLLIDGRNYE